jgi:hypothetical protein
VDEGDGNTADNVEEAVVTPAKEQATKRKPRRSDRFRCMIIYGQMTKYDPISLKV